MKKLMTLLLMVVLVFSLCSCESSPTFTISCNDGTTEAMTLSELEEIHSNEIKYIQKYDGAHIYGEGTVDSIEAIRVNGNIIGVEIGINSFTTKLVNVPAGYAVDLEIGDPIIVSGYISATMDGFVDIVADESYGVSLYSEDECKVVYDALSVARKQLVFVRNYAGNVNGQGKRAFAEEFIETLRNSLQDVDVEYVKSSLPLTAAQWEIIQNNITTVSDLLVDMGVTNSDTHVPEMKQLSSDTIAIIDYLFDNEIDENGFY